MGAAGAGGRRDYLADNLRAEYAAAHTQQDDVAIAFGADDVGELLQFGNLRADVGGQGKPAQPVVNLSGVFAPQGVVVVAQAGRDVAGCQPRRQIGHYWRVIAQMVNVGHPNFLVPQGFLWQSNFSTPRGASLPPLPSIWRVRLASPPQIGCGV